MGTYLYWSCSLNFIWCTPIAFLSKCFTGWSKRDPSRSQKMMWWTWQTIPTDGCCWQLLYCSCGHEHGLAWSWGGPWCMAFQRKVSACGECIIQINHTYYIQISRCYSEWDEESFKKLSLKRYNRSNLEDPCNRRQEPTTCNILESWGTEGMGRGGVSEIPEAWWGMVGSSGGCK